MWAVFTGVLRVVTHSHMLSANVGGAKESSSGGIALGAFGSGVLHLADVGGSVFGVLHSRNSQKRC